MKPVIAVPATLALVYRAWSRNSLTPLGILAATLTAIVHAIHPWSAPFALLVVFFLSGTAATKVKHDVKANLTLGSSGSSGGEGPRTHIQVLANSLCASILILLHTYKLSRTSSDCLAHGNDILVVGIVANYAAVAADTFSSELGILSQTKPRLVTTLRTVPPGTNGGVTPAGLMAGLLGSFTIAVTSAVLLPFCPKSSGPVGRVLASGEYRGWGLDDRVFFVVAISLWGALGSLVDSVLGALLQASVVDKRTGKIVEGRGGGRVLTHSTKSDAEVQKYLNLQRRKGERAIDAKQHEESRSVLSGWDVLDNNQINILMAAIMSFGGMAMASYVWEVPLTSILP